MKNIVLIGFMGTGKTAVGRLIAKKLNMNFIDIDERIEEIANASIKEIFKQVGEAYFRELEHRIIKEVVENIAITGNYVIATGGGVVLNKTNLDLLKKECIIIWLDAEKELIYERTKKNDTRPLLDTTYAYDMIKELITIRKPYYIKAANYKVDTSYLSVEEVTDKIINEICLRFKK